MESYRDEKPSPFAKGRLSRADTPASRYRLWTSESHVQSLKLFGLLVGDVVAKVVVRLTGSNSFADNSEVVLHFHQVEPSSSMFYCRLGIENSASNL